MPPKNIMISKLIRDFFDATEVDKAIALEQISMENGIFKFKDMIQYVRDDVYTVDQDAYKILEKEIRLLGEQNVKMKEEEKKNNPPRDDVDRRNLDLRLLQLDYKKYKKELLFIQNLIYKKGWFE